MQHVHTASPTLAAWTVLDASAKMHTASKSLVIARALCRIAEKRSVELITREMRCSPAKAWIRLAHGH